MTFCQSGFFLAGNFESRFKTNFLTAQETGLKANVKDNADVAPPDPKRGYSWGDY